MKLEGGVGAVVLAFADDELFMGHRHSEWLGVAPFLEEDLAHASIAQDELGHARALYGLVADDIDRISFARPPEDYRSSWFVELPCPAWEDALARHFLYDLAEQVRWHSLLGSEVTDGAELAVKALREEEYHVAHAARLVERLLSGTDESRSRVSGALERVYPIARSMFEPTENEADAVAAGMLSVSAMETAWVDSVRSHLQLAGVSLTWGAGPEGYGGRTGIRSEHFDEMHATMTAVYGIDPQAAW